MNASTDAPVLEAVDLAVERGGLLLFEGLSLRMHAGEALVIQGPNGAGKSSLLRAIAGLLPLAGGRITRRPTIGWTAAEPALKPDVAVADELRHWARLDGAAPAAVAAAIEAMAVGALVDLPCGMLSSGQRQRVALARTIASGARLWLLDEPANALDAASIGRLGTAIATHRAQGGLVVVATHQPLALDRAHCLEL
jgi:heme exporter protein A